MDILKNHNIEIQIAAFLIPFGIRFIPEWLAYPYPIGFDTAAYYIPIMQARLALTGGPTNFVGTILPFLLFTYAYFPIGNAILTMKIIPPLLLGFLGWSTYLFGRKTLKWNRFWSLALAFTASLNIVTLRISWDLHRNIMGLGLVMLALALLSEEKSTVRLVGLAFVTSLAVTTHEFSAVLIALMILIHLITKRRYLVLREWLPFLPAGVILVLQLAFRRGLGAQVQSSPAMPDPLAVFIFNLGFILFAFGSIIPVVLVGLKSQVERNLAAWALLCLVFGLAPGFGVSTGLAYRWLLLLAVPLSVFLVQGIKVLNSLREGLSGKVGKIAIAATLVALIFLSSGYLGVHAGVESYFALAPQYDILMPVTMVQSTISLKDLESFRSIAAWANSTLPRTAQLVLPFQLYGWYLTAVTQNGAVGPPLDQTRNLDDILSGIEPRTGPHPVYARAVDLYVPGDLPKLIGLANTIAAGNRTDVYVVWWADSEVNTYGRLPDGFIRVLTAGRFTVSSLRATLSSSSAMIYPAIHPEIDAVAQDQALQNPTSIALLDGGKLIL